MFPVQKRAGKGVKAAQINAKTGKLASSLMVNEKIDKLLLTSIKGQVIKVPLKNIPQMGRATQGVIIMRFTKKGDKVAAVACLGKNENTITKQAKTS